MLFIDDKIKLNSYRKPRRSEQGKTKNDRVLSCSIFIKNVLRLGNMMKW